MVGDRLCDEVNELFFVIVQSFSRAEVEKLQPLKEWTIVCGRRSRGVVWRGFSRA